MLNGVATAAVAAPAEASLVDQVPHARRGEALGFYLTLSMVGFNLGPLLGGTIQYVGDTVLHLGVEMSYRIPFFIDSVLALIAFILVRFGVEETRGHETPIRARQVTEAVTLSPQVHTSLRVLYITSLATGFAVGFIIPISVLYFGDLYQATPPQIGLVLTVAGFIGLTCNFFAGKLSDRIGRKPIIALGSLPSRVATLLLPFAPNFLSAAGITILRSFGHNVAMPAARALNADLIPESIRGKLFGRMSAFFNIGAIAGPILSTILYDHFRYQTLTVPWLNHIMFPGAGIPFFISGTIGLFSLALLLTFVKEPQRIQREPS
jgi:MFS family permease